MILEILTSDFYEKAESNNSLNIMICSLFNILGLVILMKFCVFNMTGWLFLEPQIKED